MPFKKITLFITCLLLFPLSTLAQDGEKTYVIKKGDTLWGISQKFLQDPHYWPNLWSNNPLVTNPHLIYPGQKISIYNGQVEIVPVDAVADAEEPIEPTIEPQESITIQVSEGASGFISQEDFDAAGTLIDTEDNRLMMGTGETVFLDLGNLAATQPGELFSLFEIRDRIKHPLTEEYIGYHVDNLGTVQITAINAEVATGEIIKAYQEIQRGAKLQPYQPLQTVIELRQADKELDGILVDAQDNR
ncbi:MAG: LysM domain-containing protein, partial [Desulfuromonadaceae bacterium]